MPLAYRCALRGVHTVRIDKVENSGEVGSIKDSEGLGRIIEVGNIK